MRVLGRRALASVPHHNVPNQTTSPGAAVQAFLQGSHFLPHFPLSRKPHNTRWRVECSRQSPFPAMSPLLTCPPLQCRCPHLAVSALCRFYFCCCCRAALVIGGGKFWCKRHGLALSLRDYKCIVSRRGGDIPKGEACI
jgi:hypothetical protein